MKFHEIIVVGSGASGLMCGALLARQGKDVLLLDKNENAGKKLMATGNGRCNFTNRKMSAECYYGERVFLDNILEQFDDRKAIELFKSFGIYHRERDGYCYPYSSQASAVVKLLVQGCMDAGVIFAFQSKVRKIVHKNGYEVYCRNGEEYCCETLVMASGGKAYESLGGDGSGYMLCRSLSHSVTSIYPGLTGLVTNRKDWTKLAGIRMQGSVSLYADDIFLKKEDGEIQIVKDGISGIPVFQLCRLAAEALDHNKRVSCVIDFLPELSEQQVAEWINQNGVEKLAGLVNQKWIPILTKGKKTDVSYLSHQFKNYMIGISDTFGIEKAQVTAGGVETDEVNPKTMESLLNKDLYLLGELLNVDGICGGYNLHFAWATAFICSEAIHSKGKNGR